MPRKARIDAPGALHHIIVRGIEWIKGDERILGGGGFVEAELNTAQENLERKYQLEAQGYGFDWLVGRVARQCGIEPKDVLAPGKYARNVKARSLLCYWGTRELGMTTVDLAKRLNLAATERKGSIISAQKIAENQKLSLTDKTSQ